MKILIAYASKNGTGSLCVQRLTERMHGKEITAVNLENGTADPAPYDIVVLGGSVYFGKLRPAVRNFMKQYEEVLLQKSLALFLCCGLDEEHEYYQKKLFPRVLQERAFCNVFFGGSLHTQGLSFFDKCILKSMRSTLFEADMDNGEYIANLPGILPENIDKLASYIQMEIIRLCSR